MSDFPCTHKAASLLSGLSSGAWFCSVELGVSPGKHSDLAPLPAGDLASCCFSLGMGWWFQGCQVLLCWQSTLVMSFICNFIPSLRSHSHFPEALLTGSIQSAVPSEGLQMPCKEKSVHAALVFLFSSVGKGKLFI